SLGGRPRTDAPRSSARLFGRLCELAAGVARGGLLWLARESRASVKWPSRNRRHVERARAVLRSAAGLAQMRHGPQLACLAACVGWPQDSLAEDSVGGGRGKPARA